MGVRKPKKPNWTRIQTEYVTGRVSQRDLAKKHGVPLRTLQDRCRAENWVALRDEHRGKTVAKACDLIAQTQARNTAELVTSAAAKLLEKAMIGIEQVDRPVTAHKEVLEEGDLKTTTEWETLSQEPGAVNVAAVRHLATALKDIAGVLGLETELDRELKEARIAALRARVPEKDDEDGTRHGVVLLPTVQPPKPPEEDNDG